MAAPAPMAAKASRWGSFLTGLESRLDTILADEDVTSKSNADTNKLGSAESEADPVDQNVQNSRGDGRARTSSSNRAQDRLNERLAKALANRNKHAANDNSTPTSNVPSRTASPANVESIPRPSLESKDEKMNGSQPALSEEHTLGDGAKSDGQEQQTRTPTMQSPRLVSDEPQIERLSMESHTAASTKPSVDYIQEGAGLPDTNGHVVFADPKRLEDYETTISQLRSDYQTAELRRQQETHDFLECIDALQSKLQYLTKEAVETAKRASASAECGSDAQELAAKDEKIALLIEEGHKLSQTGLKHMSIIKKLRAKSTEDEKACAESKQLADKNGKAAREAQERAKRAEAAERQATERAKSLPKLEKDIETLRSERDVKADFIESLQRQLSEVLIAAQESEGKAYADTVELERQRTADLEDEISKLKLDREVAEKGYLAEIRELREKAERDKERARIAEIERRGEQRILESRLEALRARAEEASAGSTESVQAKLLRQIETLQNQYTLTSENWQGIEASLLARVTTLEKERNEIYTREVDVRRKAREMSSKFRRLEEDLEKATARSLDMQQELIQQNSQLTSLQQKLSKAEADVTEARRDLQLERKAWEARQAQRAEEEKAKQRDELARSLDTQFNQFRTGSPITSTRNRKNSNPDRNSPHGRHYYGLAASRPSSTQPLRSAEIRPASRQNSATSTNHFHTNGIVPETPSITVDYQDDFFDGVLTPASPEHTVNDIVSASTAAAGPSVQLVERMSAAVRRLESEKAASKDELTRLSQQRDEAREQVVSLMREAEEKRKADERIKALEIENNIIQKRYSTTLEMLGEKSEKVEELKADVADLKQMYRELVDSTMR